MIPLDWKPIASLTLKESRLLCHPLRIRSPSRTLLFRHLLTQARTIHNGPPRGDAVKGRRLKDSFIQVHLPLCSNAALYTDYANVYGGVRMGKLLEDLDALAAAVAFLHLPDTVSCAMDDSSPDDKATLVTAAVDHIDIESDDRLITGPVTNLRLSGLLTYLGRSSMEVQITMDREVHQGHWKQVSQAYFIMVAKFMAEAHKGDKPHLIPLIADSPEEKAILAKGSRRSEQRRERREASLKVKPPTASEIAQLHQLLYMNAGPRYTESCRKVSDTVLEATKLCHPQERNLNEKIFGGYLMREAFELAFTNCLLHFRGPLECVAIDDIVFLYPVSIGDILRLSATIVYSDGRRRLLQVQVDADVIDPRDGSQLRTNTFHFTFTPRDDVQPWRDVHPETYAEAIEWLQAQRRLVSVE